jgi:hypothetical protein
MSSGPLERLQRRFVRSVTFAADAELVAATAGGGRLTAAEAVDVYRGAYPARLTEALGETYEACWRVLGDEDFFAAARGYIARTPSRSYNLSDYGESFADFLDSRPEAEHAPFLGDLARLEWALKELFHAKPHAGLTAAALASAARPGSVLRLGAAVRLLSLRRRVHDIWKRDRADDTPIVEADWTGAERLILYKKESNSVFSRALSGPEHAALSALAAGRPLEDALAGAEGLDAAGAQELFAFVAESGIVAEAK